MYAIEKKVTVNKNSTWQRVSEWSTRDLAVNLARMQFGTSNPAIRIVDTEKAEPVTNQVKRR